MGGHGVHFSTQIHQERTFRHRSACRTPAEGRQEYLKSRKEFIELIRMMELAEKTGVLIGLDQGNRSRGPIPTSGWLSESGETFKAGSETADL